jgi:hypothetical protein
MLTNVLSMAKIEAITVSHPAFGWDANEALPLKRMQMPHSSIGDQSALAVPSRYLSQTETLS